VKYVDEATARKSNLINASSTTAAQFGVDVTNKTPNGRPSIRIESKKKYDSGLIVLDVAHMPFGCGTWPAYVHQRHYASMEANISFQILDTGSQLAERRRDRYPRRRERIHEQRHDPPHLTWLPDRIRYNPILWQCHHRKLRCSRRWAVKERRMLDRTPVQAELRRRPQPGGWWRLCDCVEFRWYQYLLLPTRLGPSGRPWRQPESRGLGKACCEVCRRLRH
jgi:hypothetical protein